MTVAQLISKLKKMPQNLDVFWSDHDHGDYEVNAAVRRVWVVDKSEANDHYHQRQLKDFEDTPKKYVNIRP